MSENQKYIIGGCPNCGRPVVYSDDPRDKIKIKVSVVDANYHGKMFLCSKCKTMYAVEDISTRNNLLVTAQA